MLISGFPDPLSSIPDKLPPKLLVFRGSYVHGGDVLRTGKMEDLTKSSFPISKVFKVGYNRSGWQNLAAFRQEQKGNENFRQARIYNFCVKCVFFARNHIFAKLTQ